jgi:hypothetical protein
VSKILKYLQTTYKNVCFKKCRNNNVQQTHSREGIIQETLTTGDCSTGDGSHQEKGKETEFL